MDFEQRHRRRTASMRLVYDLAMGVIWLGVGVFFLFHRRFGYDLGLDTTLTTIFGAASMLYGAFRIYRGISSGRMR